MDKKRLSYYQSIFALVGTIIGAGVLGIPYAVAEYGFIGGLITILLLGAAILCLNLFVGEIALRTKKQHQLVGYAEKYLGRWGEYAIMTSMLIGIYGALLAYIIGEGNVLSAIFGGTPLYWSLGYFALMSFIVLIGINMVKKYELILGLILLCIVFLLVVLALPFVKINNLMNFSWYGLVAPYGVILFAFVGASAVPQMKEILVKNYKGMKKAVIIGSLIPLILYTVFATVSIGVLGMDVTEVVTIGLGSKLGWHMVLLGNLFAVFAMATSFLTLGLALKEVYHFDYGLNKTLSWALACFVPLLIFFLGAHSFVKVLGFVGGVAGGIEGITIVFTLWKAKKHGDRKPEYSLKFTRMIGYVLIVVFGLGVVYTLVG